MAYENINVTSLKNSINNCINSLDNNAIKAIKSKLTSNGSWNSQAKKNLEVAMEKLIERNKKIKEELKKCLGVADLIEEYQKLDKENNDYLNKLSSINTQLSTAKQIDDGYYQSGDQNSQAATNNKQKITNLNGQKNEINTKINSNKSKMNTLKAKIGSAI